MAGWLDGKKLQVFDILEPAKDNLRLLILPKTKN